MPSQRRPEILRRRLVAAQVAVRPSFAPRARLVPTHEALYILAVARSGSEEAGARRGLTVETGVRRLPFRGLGAEHVVLARGEVGFVVFDRELPRVELGREERLVLCRLEEDLAGSRRPTASFPISIASCSSKSLEKIPHSSFAEIFGGREHMGQVQRSTSPL